MHIVDQFPGHKKSSWTASYGGSTIKGYRSSGTKIWDTLLDKGYQLDEILAESKENMKSGRKLSVLPKSSLINL